MKGVIEYFVQIMADHDGLPSSKRWTTLVTLILMAMAFVANIFWSLKVDEHLYDGLILLSLAAMGVSGAEKIATKKTPPKNDEPG